MFKRAIGLIEVRPYEPGEELAGVTIFEEEATRHGCPKLGDLIARYPGRDGSHDRWLISEETFAEFFKSEG